MSGFEENEISINSKGGTELSKRSIAKFIPEDLSKEFQVICSRVRELHEDKIRIYWQHDLPEDPEVSHLRDASSRDRFHKFVFVSNWQLQEYVNRLGLPQDDKVIVIENPIDPFPEVEKSKDEVRLIYFSTPHRGLDILIPVFEELATKHDNIHLDVFSSYQIYGWGDSDKGFEPLYDRVRNHPKMTYHGFVEQDVLREHVLKSHILAFPSVWKETSCRVLMEAMSAGLICVHPNLAALSETSGGLTSMYQYLDDKNKHAALFYYNLDHAISIAHNTEAQNYLRFAKAYADNRYNLNKIGSQWRLIMEDLSLQYADVGKRKIPKEMFYYKT
jgi:glycosyltransferase involved in cell wall biosynthesis